MREMSPMIEFLKGVLDRTGKVLVHFPEEVTELLTFVDYPTKIRYTHQGTCEISKKNIDNDKELQEYWNQLNESSDGIYY